MLRISCQGTRPPRQSGSTLTGSNSRVHSESSRRVKYSNVRSRWQPRSRLVHVFIGQKPGFEHAGNLGMGVLKSYRRQGLGYRLVRAAIDLVWDEGLTRVELEVFASNTAAISLYTKCGFEREGVKRRARYIDGKYDDIILMALLREPTSNG